MASMVVGGRGRAGLAGAAATAIALASTSAQAQTTPPAPPSAAGEAPPSAAADSAIAEIVVTAQRRAESSQRAAIPLDVIAPGKLANAGVVTPETLNAAVPALIVQKAGGPNTVFYLRGVGNFTVNAYADPAIAFNLDGVYLGRPTSTTGTFFDLDRIEVLKGPQGTLYGRNATGGAVNVIPAKPRLGETGGFATLSYGRYDAWDGEAAINLAIGDKAAFRVSGKIVDRDGYTKDGTNDEVGHGVRAQLLLEPSEDVTLRIAGDYSHQGGVGPGGSFEGVYGFVPGAPATDTSIANYRFTPTTLDPYEGIQSPASRAYAATFTIPGAFIRPGASLYPRQDNDYWGVLAEASIDTGIGTITILPAYRESRLDSAFNGPNFAGGIVREKDKQTSVEARIAGEPIGPIDWLIGGYYFDEDIAARYTFSQYQVQSYQRFTTGTESYAAFGRITANVSDDFRLVGGIRQTRDRKAFLSSVQTLVEICSNPPPPAGPGCFANNSGSVPAVATLADLPGRPTLPGPMNSVPFGTAGNRIFFTQFATDLDRTDNRTTYRAAAEYDVAPASLLYASYETGFRGGGFSNSLGRETFDPEYLTAWTLGSKNRFLDNRLQVNLELFYWKYRNQQVSHFGFDANNASSLFTENIGKSTIKGADLDIQARAATNTLLRASVQYLENELTSFVYETPRGGTNLPPVTGCAVTNGGSGASLTYVIDCSNTDGYNSPKWSFNLSGDQTIPLGDYKAVVTAEVRYRGNRVIGFEKLPQMNSTSDTTVDLNATFGPNDNQWFLSGYVRNVTNTRIKTATQYQGSTGGVIVTFFNQPRSYGVRAGVKF